MPSYVSAGQTHHCSLILTALGLLDGRWAICSFLGQEGEDTGHGALNGLSVGASLKNKWLASVPC